MWYYLERVEYHYTLTLNPSKVINLLHQREKWKPYSQAAGRPFAGKGENDALFVVSRKNTRMKVEFSQFSTNLKTMFCFADCKLSGLLTV